MLLDRTHKRWFAGSTLTVAIGAAAYLANALSSIQGAKGGSVLGMLFGIVGSACMVFSALLALRRRLPTLRVGSAQFWLRGHVWLGTVGFLLILLHSGLRWGGLLENLMWVSFVLVVVTGIIGVILQQIIPRLLTSEVPLETIVSQIPSLSNMSVFRADKIVASKVGVLEVDFEPLRMDALSVLKRQEQSIGDRPGDFPKELAKVYANVPFIEPNKPPPLVPALAPIVPTKQPLGIVATPSAVFAEGNPLAKLVPPLDVLPEVAAAAADERPANPKSPLEIMREKALSQASGSVVKPKTPLEILREKAAAKAAGEVLVKRKTPLDFMREKAAAKTPSDGQAKAKTPLEIMREKAAAKAAAVPNTPVGLRRDMTAADDVAKIGPGTKSSLDILRERGVSTLVPDEVPESPLPPNATPTAPEKSPAPIEPTSAKEDAPVGVSLMSGKPLNPLITITCESCGKVFTVAPRHAGKKGRCPVDECKAPYTVPIPDEPPVEPLSAVLPQNPTAPVVERKPSVIDQFKVKLAAMTLNRRPKISIMCANCGKVFSVSARHAGEQGRCPVDACQAPYTVPHPAPTSDESATPPRSGEQQPLTQNKPLRIIQGDESRLSLPDEDSVETFGPLDQIPAPPPRNEPKTLPSVEPEKPIIQRSAQPAPTETQTLPGIEAEIPLAPRPVQREYNVAQTLVGDEPETPLVSIEQRSAPPAPTETQTLPIVEAEIPLAPRPVQREYNVAQTLVGNEPETPLTPIEKVPAQTELSAVPTPPSDKPPKKLSPIEQMRANKLAAAKESPASPPAGAPKPITLEKPAVVPPVAEKPAAAVPAKLRPKKVPAPIAPALLTVLRDFHIKVVRPFLINGRSPKRRLEDSDSARQLFTQLRAELPAELHDALQQLFVLCEERRQFNTQLRLHRWLHWWLLVHIPPSIALLVLFVAHVVVSLRVVPFIR